MSEYMVLGDLISPSKVNRCGNGKYPVLSMTMHDGIVLQNDRFKKSLASLDQSNYKVVKKGQLVVGFPIDEGVLYVQKAVSEGIMSPAYNVWDIRNDIVNADYLELCLHSPQAMQFYKTNLRGTTARRRSIPTETLLALKILVPSLDTQSKVVTIINKITSLISERSEQLAVLNELIKSRFIELFGDVIRNSKSWPMHMFSEIASSRLGKMLDAKRQTGLCSYPYLANFNVQWFKFNIEELNQMDFDEDDRTEFELKDGDLLVCEGGEIGRCAVWHNEIQPCFFQKALHRVRCDRDMVHPDYLAWWFKYQCNHNGFSAIAGAKATIAHLPGVKLKQLQVAVPPLELQQHFADFVAQVDKSKCSVQKSLQELETLKKSLMQQYFG